MPDVAVIFGGPSPEHDVSVLTGLQAARGLAGRPATGPGRAAVRALFWSKTGDWYEVDPTLEAEAFLEGVPRGATRLQLTAAPDGGFAEPGGRWARPGSSTSMPRWCAATGDRARTAPSRPPSTWPASATRVPRCPGPRSAWTSWPSAPWWPPAGLPTLPRVLLAAGATRPPFAGPYIVKPRFGGSSIGIDVVEDVGHRPGPAPAPIPISGSGPWSSPTGPT